MRTADGALISIEFLENDPGLSRHTEAILKNLRLLGLQATIRQLDPAQFAQRVREFDYDLISARFSMSLTPGESIKLLFGSEAAGTKGSRNLSGIADPAIDAMIEKVIAADTREEITTATRALDRLLRAGRYWIGAWHSAMHRYAYWDMFGRPGPFPPLAGSASASAAATWWLDAEKAKRIGR
jgi:microcin C transport system substrate-binding protein